MPDISGIELLRSLPTPPMVIFTTAYSEHAVQSFELDAIDYLLKPFSFQRFEKAVIKARDRYNLLHNTTASEQLKYLMLKADYGVIKVMLTDIEFIEGLDNYLKIHLHKKSPIVVRMTLRSLLEKLPPAEFIRVHRSFIVSVARIESIKQKIIQIGGEEIPVGKNYEDELKQLLDGRM